MSEDLEKKLEEVCKAISTSAEDYHKSTILCIEALQGIHERLERIEKWIENEERKAVNR